MKRRALSVFIVVAALLLLAVPVAGAFPDLFVSGMAPLTGSNGQLLTATVFADLYYPVDHLNFTPTITLTRGSTTITAWGVTVISPAQATMIFPIPNDAPPGLYDLNVQQTVGLTSHEGTRLNAFTVVQRPIITSITPATATAGSSDLTVTVDGLNFIKIYTPTPRQSELQVNGLSVPSTYVSPTTITAVIPAASLANVGTLSLTVVNTGTKYDPETYSDPVSFAVKAPTAPTIASLSPTSVWAGSVRTDTVLTVTGTNFVGTSQVTLNGIGKAGTTFVGATQLRLTLAPADVATAGTVNVGVANPPFPGGGVSATTVPLTVQAETSTPAVTISGADSGAWYNAPVALTFSATDSQSGVQKVQFMAPPAVASWTDGTAYTVPVATQGSVTVSAQALDWCNQAGSASITVGIDTTAPGTKALRNVTVKKGKTAKLGFRVTEPAGLSPTATARIDIQKSNGKVVKSFPIANVPVNSDRSQSFTCKLAKGTYKWYVYATDLAGNQQANVASAKLKVK